MPSYCWRAGLGSRVLGVFSLLVNQQCDVRRTKTAAGNGGISHELEMQSEEKADAETALCPVARLFYGL